MHTRKNGDVWENQLIMQILHNLIAACIEKFPRATKKPTNYRTWVESCVPNGFFCHGSNKGP
eukprot:UN16900